MSRFFLSTSGLAALLAASAPAFADTNDEDSGHDLASDIVVTGRLEDRSLHELKTPALGVGIDGRQIAAINAINAEDAVRYAPALVVRKRFIGDANATLSFRNMHSTQTPRALVTVDGFNISNFLGADFDTAPKWGVLAPDDIARAEIIYGPTSARYSGNSMGGTLLLKTRDITASAARLSTQVFSQNYKYYKTDEDLFGWAVDAGFDFTLGSRGGLSISYRHFENKGQPMEWRTVNASSPFGSQGIVDKELSFLRIGAQDSTVDSSEDQLRMRGQYDLGGGWALHGLAALFAKREDTLHPKTFLRDASGAATFIGIDGVNVGAARSTELLMGVGLSGEAASWKLDVSFSRFDVLDDKTRTSDNFDVVTGARPLAGRLLGYDAGWNSLEVSAEKSFGVHTLALGLSYAGYSDNNRTYTATDWLHATVTGLRDASGGKTRLIGAFVEDGITLSPRFIATFGLRYETWRASQGFLTAAGATDRYGERHNDAWSPKAALSFKPDALTQIVVSASLATRFPTVGELYQAGLIAYGANVGELDLNGFNPALKPERAIDLQVTTSRRFGNVKMTLSGYRQDVRDTIFSQTIAVPDAVTGDLTQSSLMTNIGNVRTWGADLIVSAEQVLIDGLSIDANVSWIDAEVTRNPLNPALVGNKFPRVPMWRANASLRYSPTADWTLAANFRHQSTPDRNIENSSTSRCDTFYCVSSFSFVDVKASRRLGAIELSAGVDNLLNEKAFVYHPYPGRTFVFSLKWNGEFQ
ncbi:TonB-dependent receptor [Novosphingobium sp. G106]|uniref:TonB-dependent receptor n=1 Tax=Novosphingobium sp. G106 TaxID=2849500 RepID=UPI001C2D5DFE|nr:TonB-dependent receptor [Novosphingobium sp. G106]MBV1692029.1 TonB-dependent receptor [Novosphingobium sp. G106]